MLPKTIVSSRSPLMMDRVTDKSYDGYLGRGYLGGRMAERVRRAKRRHAAGSLVQDQELEPDGFRPYLESLATRLVKDAAWVDDAIQDACERAIRRLTADNPRNLRGWLGAILRSVIVDHWRQLERDRKLHAELATAPEPGEWQVAQDAVAKQEWSTIDSDQVTRALAQLTPAFRIAFERVVVERRSYSEVAKMLSVPYGTVATRVFRARRDLRRLLLRTLSGAQS